MKKMQFTITVLLLMGISTFVFADFTNMYGDYESIPLRDMYATNKNLTPEQKEYSESLRLSITINESNVLVAVGGEGDEKILKMNYYIIKKDFILAYYGEGNKKMYYPIYFKNNIIYAIGQSFEKK